MASGSRWGDSIFLGGEEGRGGGMQLAGEIQISI